MPGPGDLIRILREKKGLTLREMSEKVGISFSTLGKKERGIVSISELEREQLAEFFGLSLEEFDKRWKPPPPGRTRGGPGIPVINRASAGTIVDYEEYGVDSGQGFEYLDWGDVSEVDAFAVIVVGDSMKPMLHEGDYVVLTPRDAYEETRPVPNGSIVLIRFTQDAGGGGCLCRWHLGKGGEITLTKDNPKYPPRTARREDIEQLAVAIERRSRRMI